MALLKRYLRLELKTLLKNNIRFRVIGRADELAPDIRDELRGGRSDGPQATPACCSTSRSTTAAARRSSTRRGARSRDGVDPPRRSTSGASREFLYTAGQPDPDLLIRTSGEMRVSNFLLWQIAYAEIWVTDTLWPDFRARHLLEAILAYQKRDRRYGGIKPTRWPSVALGRLNDARPERAPCSSSIAVRASSGSLPPSWRRSRSPRCSPLVGAAEYVDARARAAAVSACLAWSPPLVAAIVACAAFAWRRERAGRRRAAVRPLVARRRDRSRWTAGASPRGLPRAAVLCPARSTSAAARRAGGDPRDGGARPRRCCC